MQNCYDRHMDEFTGERNYWLALSLCDGIGPVRFQKLLQHFGSAKNAWDAPFAALVESGIGEKISEDLIGHKKKFSLRKYETELQQLQVSYTTLQDEEYPVLLKQIKKPPIILYKKGTYSFNKNDILVSFVGTRKVTEYGRSVTELLVKDLVAAGCVIVSGLAVGIDAVAAQAAIASGGKTIAVLGSGVDLCTPAENTGLYTRILENGGAIVSENPLGMQPTIGSFPARNRIIAGLARGVLVTEGAADSGSLITANFAFEFERSVFAVPGPITSSVSKGPLSLIARGAKLVMAASDILEELKIAGAAGSKNIKGVMKFKNASKEETKIITVLQDQNMHFDELVRKTGFSSSRLGILLSFMEVKGMIKSLDGGNYCLTT